MTNYLQKLLPATIIIACVDTINPFGYWVMPVAIKNWKSQSCCRLNMFI